MTTLALELITTASAADQITFDRDAAVTGMLSEWQSDRECRIEVSEGPLTDAVVLVPCARISRFERASAVVASVLETESVAPGRMELPLDVPAFDATEAQRRVPVPVEDIEVSGPAS